MTVWLYLPLCCGRTAREVIEEEDSYASRFYRWLFRKLKELSFISRGYAWFNWYSCTIARSKVSAMTVYDMATKALGTEPFPQNSIAGLISGITFIVFFSQEKPLRWKEIHTHTPTHTQHTHTHTQTHTCTKWMAPNKCCGIIFWALLRPSTLEYHADCFEKIPEREGSISPATIIFIIFRDSLMF